MINKFLLFLFGFLMSTQANAHIGSHTEITFENIFQHALSSPFHTGIGLAVVAGVSFLLIKKYG